MGVGLGTATLLKKKTAQKYWFFTILGFCAKMAPDRPKMTPEAPIWWESTKNVSRTPFQCKRVAPASLGPKGPLKFFSLWARWRRAPQGARSAFSPHYIFLHISVTPITKNWGPGAPRPLSALIFPKHIILGHFGPKWGPGGAGWPPSWKIFFGMCSSLVPPFVYQFLSRYLHPRLRSEGGGTPSGTTHKIALQR